MKTAFPHCESYFALILRERKTFNGIHNIKLLNLLLFSNWIVYILVVGKGAMNKMQLWLANAWKMWEEFNMAFFLRIFIQT